MTQHTNGMVKIIDRKEQVLAAQPAPFVALRAAAESLSRRNIFGAHVELCNEALQKLTVMLYEQDAAGRWVNIDRSGMLRIPAPWGRGGQKRWAMRRSEADVMRKVMQGHQQRHDKGKEPALYLYLEGERRWYVNLADYPDGERAMQWVRAHQLTVNAWRYHTEGIE